MSGRALEGIRVLDFTWVLAGPIMTRALAYHGAEVIRIETNKRLDPVIPFFAVNAETHAGKLSAGLDVSHPEGMKLFERLVKVSDVVADNYAAGVLARLGLTNERLSEINPKIIQLTMPAMGSSGPHKSDVTFGPNIHAVAGLDHLTGYPDATPGGIGIAYADYAAPGHAIVAILAALAYRDKSGKGQLIDLSQFESLVSLLGPEMLTYFVNGEEPIRKGNDNSHQAPYNCYPTRGQDKWVAIAVSSDAEWVKLCGAMGKPSLANDPKFATLAQRLRNQKALDKIVGEWTAPKTAYEVMITLQSQGVPSGMVLDIPEVIEDRQLIARDFLHFGYPDHWLGKLNTGGIQAKLSETPGFAKTPAPYMGEHNDYVFGTLLGMSKDEISKYVEKKVIEVTKPEDYPVPPQMAAMFPKKK